MIQKEIVNTGEVGSAVQDWFNKVKYIADLPETSPFYSINIVQERDDRLTMLMYKDRTIAMVTERRNDFNYVEIIKVKLEYEPAHTTKIGRVESLGEIPKLRSDSLYLEGFGLPIREYFLVSTTNNLVSVQSGLNNPTYRSPYYYSDITIGEDCVQQALDNFNKFLEEHDL